MKRQDDSAYGSQNQRSLSKSNRDKNSITFDKRKQEEYPQEAGTPIGKLFQFDPDNMSKNDIVQIAENADQLIKIISNIKDQVGVVKQSDDIVGEGL